MRRGTLLAALAVAIVGAAGAGCGGSSSEPAQETANAARFERSGFDITFDYPLDFRPDDNLRFASTAGKRHSASTAVGLDRENVIVVSRYDLMRPVTAQNIAGVKAEVDDVITKLAGKQHSGRRVDYGGLPGYAYSVRLSSPEEGLSRVYVLFDDDVEYFLNCQSTPDVRYVLDAACRQALDTLDRK
jgi:hypothetical protein